MRIQVIHAIFHISRTFRTIAELQVRIVLLGTSADRAMPVIAVGFLSAYLPWVLVSRLTFIYHYFASVPFIILATAQGLRYLERRNRALSHALTAVLVVAAVALFIAFYPYASGLEVSREWLARMNWFKNWMWY